MDLEERWVSARSAARYVGLHHDTLGKMRREGGGPAYVRKKSRILYDIRELDRWMAEDTFTSTADEAVRGSCRQGVDD